MFVSRKPPVHVRASADISSNDDDDSPNLVNTNNNSNEGTANMDRSLEKRGSAARKPSVVTSRKPSAVDVRKNSVQQTNRTRQMSTTGSVARRVGSTNAVSPRTTSMRKPAELSPESPKETKRFDDAPVSPASPASPAVQEKEPTPAARFEPVVEEYQLPNTPSNISEPIPAALLISVPVASMANTTSSQQQQQQQQQQQSRHRSISDGSDTQPTPVQSEEPVAAPTSMQHVVVAKTISVKRKASTESSSSSSSQGK